MTMIRTSDTSSRLPTAGVLLLSLVLLAVLGTPLPSPAAEGSASSSPPLPSPLALVRTTVEEMAAVLEKTAHQDAAGFSQIREIVRPHFDVQEMARRSLGRHWRDRTETERQEFAQLFFSLIEQTYRAPLDQYTAEVEFFFDAERIEGNSSEVQTRLLNPALAKTFSISYRLHQIDARWLVYDITIENVSMVRNYRTQFSRIIQKSSYAELVQALKRKLQQLSEQS